MRARYMSLRTEQAYLHWMRRFVRHHGRVSPRQLGAAHVEAFLSSLATTRRVSAATQNQALCAILFLSRQVLKMELPWLANLVRAAPSRHLPVVLTREEVRRLLAELRGTHWLMASLLYGSGLRLHECLTLRVKDVDAGRGELVVRDGKGGKDRVTMLPASLRVPLAGHFARLQEWFDNERRLKRPGASLPHALERKYPLAATSWG